MRLSDREIGMYYNKFELNFYTVTVEIEFSECEFFLKYITEKIESYELEEDWRAEHEGT